MLKKARVYKSAKREFVCKFEHEKDEVIARARGNLLKGDENTIVVGDYVMIDQNEMAIVEVLPRVNEIFRLVVREQKKKVSAANCDLMVIVTTITGPHYKRGIIDRFLVRAAEWGITPLVVFNKMDQITQDKTASDFDVDLQFEKDRLSALDVECFEVSATEHMTYGPRFFTLSFADLKGKLKGKTSIFLGQSGVGKSKLITAVSDGKIKLLSQDIGRVGKGKHTTTWSEIVDCEEMALIDSPGIRSFGLEDLLDCDLISFFPDIEKWSVKCKFSNCEHLPSSQDCFFRTQFPEGERNTRLILSRLDSYLRMKEEISQIPTYLKISQKSKKN